MSEQVRKQRPASERKSEGEGPSKRDTAERDAHLKELDDVLDEIDGVLEENAEDFVKAYVQKGGQ